MEFARFLKLGFRGCRARSINGEESPYFVGLIMDGLLMVLGQDAGEAHGQEHGMKVYVGFIYAPQGTRKSSDRESTLNPVRHSGIMYGNIP